MTKPQPSSDSLTICCLPVQSWLSLRNGASLGSRVGKCLAGTVLVVAGVLLSASTSPASTFPNKFGSRYLQNYQSPVCCNGQALNGTQANVSVSSLGPDATQCVLFSSEIEEVNDGPAAVQSGIVRCGSSSTGLDGTCSLSNNQVLFVETINSSNNAHCVAHGAAAYSTDYKFGTEDPSGSTYYGTINGVLDESVSFTGGPAHLITEGGEHTNVDTCTGWTGAATLGDTGAPWSRYVLSSTTWVTVQSANTSAGCWTLTGGPPGSFNVSH
jgi:hypothetical protein